MIPLRDENPVKSFPLITVVIIILNIAVFIYELAVGQELGNKIYFFTAVPYSITHPHTPFVFLTLVTSLFAHVSVFHLVGNMLYLWVFGNNIEDRLGRARFIIFYLTCGIAASLGHISMAPDSRLPLIGASGAISGVLGAYILLFPRAKILVLVPLLFFWPVIRLEASFFLFFWIIMQFFYGTTSFVLMDAQGKGGVAWFAHIFGFFAGMLFILLLLAHKKKKRRSYAIVNS